MDHDKNNRNSRTEESQLNLQIIIVMARGNCSFTPDCQTSLGPMKFRQWKETKVSGAILNESIVGSTDFEKVQQVIGQ